MYVVCILITIIINVGFSFYSLSSVQCSIAIQSFVYYGFVIYFFRLFRQCAHCFRWCSPQSHSFLIIRKNPLKIIYLMKCICKKPNPNRQLILNFPNGFCFLSCSVPKYVFCGENISLEAYAFWFLGHSNNYHQTLDSLLL